MKIYNERDEIISQDEVDYEEGYTIPDVIITQTFAPQTKEVSSAYYEPVVVFFQDGTQKLLAPDDSHIRVIDASIGRFEYVFAEGETSKDVIFISTKKVQGPATVIEYTPQPETEEILRYVLYTPEELREKAKVQENIDFQKTGPMRLADNEAAIADLTLSMAQLLGVM